MSKAISNSNKSFRQLPLSALIGTLLFSAAFESSSTAYAQSGDAPFKQTAKRRHGYLRPQNDLVNHSLMWGIDIPPNERFAPNKSPSTQNDFLLLQKKNKEILAQEPKNVHALVELGYACRNLNDLKTDIDCCSRAIEENSKFAAAYSERGMAYEGMEDYANALSDFTKAIAFDSKNPFYYAHLGRLYLREKKMQDAINACTISIGMSSQNPAVFYYRGKAYAHGGQFQKAAADYDKAIQLDENGDIGFYVDRAYAYTQLDLILKALDDLKVAIKIDSDDFPRQLDIAFTAGESENTPEARQRIFDLGRELVDVKPYSLALQKALFSRFRRKYSDAIAIFDEVIKENPQNAESYLYRGETFSDMDDELKAIDNYSKVLQLEPANADAFNYRARSFFKQKDYTKAIDDLNQLIKIRPDRYAYMMRSGAYRAIGNIEKSDEDRKNFLQFAQNTYRARNNPSPENFSKFLERDLDAFFSKKLGKKTHVDYEELPTSITPLMIFGLPRSYYWLKITVDGKSVDQGAACLLGVQRERFVVHKYASITEIRKNPDTIDSTCPSQVRDAIFQHAGLSRPL